MTPIALAQAQLEAYNARDLERFAACYAPDVAVYRPPAPEPALRGQAAFRAFYATQRFNRPALRAELVNRIAFGNKVIDHERIFGIADQPIEMAVAYEIKNGLIQTVWSFAAG